MTLKIKVLSVFAAVALVLGASVPAASALTTSELIDLLVSMGIIPADQAATAQAAVGGSASAGASTCALKDAPDMTVGAQGASVTELQMFLVDGGYLSMPAGVAYGYFGSLTQSALASYQAAMGISPAVGYFGPVTKASINCEVVAPGVDDEDEDDDSDSSDLSGGEGYFEVDEVLDADVEIDLDDTETVMEFDIEAIDSDIQIDRVDFLFSHRPWLYFDEVNLLVDGDEVASLTDSDDFREVGSDWRGRFTDVDTVIEEDDTVEFALELVVSGSLSGDRDEDTITVELAADAVRGFDADGIQQYGPESGNGISLDVTFDEAFGDGDVDVTLGDDSPDNATIVLDEDSKTDDVTVVEFDVEADDSDIEVTDVTVEFATGSGATTSVAQLVNRARLYAGNTLLGTESVNGDSVVFDDVEFDIEEDDIETLRVEVDFNESEGLTLGDFTVEEVTVDAENGDFEDVSDTLTVNETHTLVEQGLIEEYVTKSSNTSEVGDDTVATFSFETELVAVEETFYIDEDGSGFVVSLDNNDTATITIDIIDTDATLVGSDAYRISKGSSETFTVEVKVEATSTSTQEAVRATLDSLTFWTNSDLDEGEDSVTLGAPDYRSGTEIVYNEA